MPLYFRSRRPLSKRAQYALAFGALAVVLLGLFGWLAVRYDRSRPKQEPQESSSVVETYTAEDTGRLLLLLTDEGAEQYWLIQASPLRKAVYVAPLPANTTDAQGNTLTYLLRKSGPAKVAQAAHEATGLPIKKYLAVSAKDAESFLSELGGHVTYTLPEGVSFADEEGATVNLAAGTQPLTAAQTAGLLRYTGWSSTNVRLQATGDILATLLNTYLLPERSLRGDFASLSNLADTNLRIDDFTGYHTRLEYLAQANALSPLCVRIDVVGTTNAQGHFIPDTTAVRRSPLAD